MTEPCKSSRETITYFEKPGRHNTEETLRLAKERTEERGLGHVVIASTTGRVGLKAIREFEELDVEVIIVSEHYGYKEEGKWFMKPEYKEKLESAGFKVMTQSHVLAGVERSVTQNLGGTSRVETIAEALRRLIGVGVKVCVEIAIMAADSGFIPCSSEVEVMSIAGYAGGADTAVILRPAHMNNFFDLEVREFVCMPRLHRPAYPSG